MSDRSRILRRQSAGKNHEVVSVKSDRRVCSRPCAQCPWRTDVPTGVFPAEAFRISANTAEDMSVHTFGCHMTTTDRSSTCAGFLISGADHNLAVRMGRATGTIPLDVESPFPLYANYREMAEANGVDHDDPALASCRD